MFIFFPNNCDSQKLYVWKLITGMVLMIQGNPIYQCYLHLCSVALLDQYLLGLVQIQQGKEQFTNATPQARLT